MGTWDVDQLIAKAMADVGQVHTYLPTAHRERQRQTLMRICTQEKLNIRDRDTKNFGDKKGILLELVVESDPDFPSQSAEEKQISDFLLALMRPGPLRVGRSKQGLTNPDFILTKIEGSVVKIVGIVEVKTRDPDYIRQLVRHQESVYAVVKSLRNRFAKGGQPPQHPDFSWPKQIKDIEIDPSYVSILYVADKEPRPLGKWDVRATVFSKKEIERLINSGFWKSLIAKGGASAAAREEEDSEMAVKRAPVLQHVRRNDAVDVRKHEIRQECEDMDKRNPTTMPRADQICRNLREGGRECGNLLSTDQVYYLDKERTKKGCERCSAENCLNQLRLVRQNVLDAIKNVLKFVPEWDDKPIGRYAQAEFKRIQAELGPMSTFLPSLVEARNIRVKVDYEAVAALLQWVRDTISAEEESWLTKGFLAAADKIQADQKSLSGQDSRIQRGNSYNLTEQALSLCSEVSQRVTIQQRVDYINRGLVPEITALLESHTETTPGKALLEELRSVTRRAEQFSNLDFYRHGNKPSIESSRLLQTAKDLKEKVVGIESRLAQASLAAEVFSSLDLDLGYENEVEVVPAVQEDSDDDESVEEALTTAPSDGSPRLVESDDDEVDDASTIGALLTPEQKAALRESCSDEVAADDDEQADEPTSAPVVAAPVSVRAQSPDNKYCMYCQEETILPADAQRCYRCGMRQTI